MSLLSEAADICTQKIEVTNQYMYVVMFCMYIKHSQQESTYVHVYVFINVSYRIARNIDGG